MKNCNLSLVGRFMSKRTDQTANESDPWEKLRSEFDRNLPADRTGLLRFRSKSQHTQSPSDFIPDPAANLSDSVSSALRRLLYESGQFTQFLSALSQLTLGLEQQEISGQDWREMLARLIIQSLSNQPSGDSETITETDQFGYKPFATIIPDTLGGLENAWNVLFRHQADSSLPFSEMKIREIEQTLFRNLGIPLPLNEFGISEKWHREAIENVDDFFRFSIALKEYSTCFGQMFPLACARFDEEEACGRQSRRRVRDYYLDWLNACEYAYDKITATPHFSRAYGNLINTYVSLRRNVNRFTEQMSGLMNLPTQKDLDQSHLTQHILRKNHADMKEQLDEVQIQRKVDEAHQETRFQHLMSEIAFLRDQVLILKQHVDKNSTLADEKSQSPDDSSDRMH